jgi:ribonuclease P protein component
VHTQAFTIVAAPGEGERPRLGVAVSRRIGNAVVRARVRRLIREVFRRIAARLPVVDVVVVAKPSSSALTQGGLDRVATMLIPAIEKACGRVAPHAPEGPKE